MQGKGFEHSLELYFFFVTLIFYLIYLFIGKGLNPQTFLGAQSTIWQVVKGPPITKVEAHKWPSSNLGVPLPTYICPK